MRRTFATIVSATAALLVLTAAPARAAQSDYFLTIDDIAADGSVLPATTIELASWSFGASNPTSVGSSGMSAGRSAAPLTAPPPFDGLVTVVTARERGSGMATGRRSCAAGKHFPKATLTHRRQSWVLQEVIVSNCAADGMTLSYRSATPVVAPAEDGAKIGKSRSNIQNN